ncbi:MAG: hypothetical protein A2Y94_00730 [Caldithrix sp. RBG_13_44_9]|nr:MAG: hypothetical protein A2Y94_00730 [Caldithrix sp. RBG_13_44_9]
MPFFLVIAFLFFYNNVNSCTTAILSGKCTPDGRPLLYKHRDADSLENKLLYFTDGKYDYIGLVNSKDSLGKQVWAGCNSMGFVIMNSASYNLNIKDTAKVEERDGFLMKQALQTCATISDFENLLASLKYPSGIESNFGVIDAKGGAAYFETGNNSFVKYNANDPIVAPFGYLIRTNYSFSRDINEGSGYIRYETAHSLFYNASAINNLSVPFLFNDVSRCLKHSLTEIDLWDFCPPSSERPCFVSFRDFIVRDYSTAVAVIQGVKPGEDPQFTTFWCALGLPFASVAVPVWIKGGKLLPAVLTAEGSLNAPLSQITLELRDDCFPIKRGNGLYYLNLAAVINKENTGMLQKLHPLELKIFEETEQKLNFWHQNGMNSVKIQEYYRWLDQLVRSEYERLFGLKP